MWEQIRANKRKSVVLVLLMAVLLLALGFAIGVAVGPVSHYALSEGESRTIGGWESLNYGAGFLGLGVAAFLWFCLSLTAYFSGGKLLMAASGARAIEKQDHPQLYNVVEEMAIASGLSKLPKIYILNDQALNAFAAGRDPDHAAIAVTAGLLGKLNRDELQGVVAHEMSHIINRDVLFMTMIGVMVGSIVMISDVFLRGLYYSSFGHRRHSRTSSSRGGGNQAQMIMMVVAVVFAVLAPMLAYVIYFASSRRREYLADASAAMLTRYPEGLASALEAIGGDRKPLGSANKATAPMYIANPFKKAKVSAWSSTHPPIQERVRVLRSVGGSVSYGAYQEAWRQIGGKRAGSLPASALAGAEAFDVRSPAAERTGKPGARGQMREATDLLRRVNDYLFLSCVCVMRIKLPPGFKRDHVSCPRCSRDHRVPVAQLAAMSEVADAVDSQQAKRPRRSGGRGRKAAKAAPPLEVARSDGWTSFQCTCGRNINLSPDFMLDSISCKKCKREIRLVKG